MSRIPTPEHLAVGLSLKVSVYCDLVLQELVRYGGTSMTINEVDVASKVVAAFKVKGWNAVYDPVTAILVVSAPAKTYQEVG